MCHLPTIAFSYDERSDFAVQRNLNTEAESDRLLDRVTLTDRGDKDQTYKYWVIINKLVDSNTLRAKSDHPNYALGETPGLS